MQVAIGKKLYQVNRKRFESILEIGKEQVPFGIYAVERNGYAEMLHLHCKSMTELKNLIRKFRTQGYKVYANKGDVNE